MANILAYSRSSGFSTGQQEQYDDGAQPPPISKNPTFSDYSVGGFSDRTKKMTPRTESLCHAIGLEIDSTPRNWASPHFASAARDTPRTMNLQASGSSGVAAFGGIEALKAQQALTEEVRRSLRAEEAALAEVAALRHELEGVRQQMAVQEANVKREALEAIEVLERKNMRDLDSANERTKEALEASKMENEAGKEVFFRATRAEVLRVKELLGTELVAVRKEKDLLLQEVEELRDQLEHASSDDEAHPNRTPARGGNAGSELGTPIGVSLPQSQMEFLAAGSTRSSSKGQRTSNSIREMKLEAEDLVILEMLDEVNRRLQKLEGEASGLQVTALELLLQKKQAEDIKDAMVQRVEEIEREKEEIRDEVLELRSGREGVEDLCRKLNSELRRKDELMQQGLDLSKRCLDDRRAVFQRLQDAHAELTTQRAICKANGGISDRAALDAVHRLLGDDIAMPDLEYIGLEKDLGEMDVDCCVCGKVFEDENDLKRHMKKSHSDDIIKSVASASKDRTFSRVADELLAPEESEVARPGHLFGKGLVGVVAANRIKAGGVLAAEATAQRTRAARNVTYGSFT